MKQNGFMFTTVSQQKSHITNNCQIRKPANSILLWGHANTHFKKFYKHKKVILVTNKFSDEV